MQITPEIHRVDGIKGAHAYLLLVQPLTLVDTGLPGQERLFADYLGKLGYTLQSVRQIVITHYDLDHVGSAAALKTMSGATVCAHRKDVPYIEERQPRPGIKRVLPLLTAPVYGRLKPVEVDVALEGDTSLGKLRIIETPGHSPGHICVALGDAFLIGDLLQGGVKEAPGFFIWQRSLARESVKKIARLRPNLLLPGHGEPDIEPEEKLRSLIAAWG